MCLVLYKWCEREFLLERAYSLNRQEWQSIGGEIGTERRSDLLGHTVDQWQSWEPNPGFPVPTSVPSPLPASSQVLRSWSEPGSVVLPIHASHSSTARTEGNFTFAGGCRYAATVMYVEYNTYPLQNHSSNSLSTP